MAEQRITIVARARRRPTKSVVLYFSFFSFFEFLLSVGSQRRNEFYVVGTQYAHIWMYAVTKTFGTRSVAHVVMVTLLKTFAGYEALRQYFSSGSCFCFPRWIGGSCSSVCDVDVEYVASNAVAWPIFSHKIYWTHTAHTLTTHTQMTASSVRRCRRRHSANSIQSIFNFKYWK